jgi:hypothetical protein
LDAAVLPFVALATDIAPCFRRSSGPAASRVTKPPRVGPLNAGIFFATAALLLLQVALTRILSVVMWYHFAFFTISVALFGLAASGMVVYLLPGVFRSSRALLHVFLAAAGLAVAVPVCFLLFAANPAQAFVTGFLRRAGEGGIDGVAVLQTLALYLSAVVPFFVGGLVGAVLFRHFGSAASRLYSYDLIGAGLGCLAAIPVLDRIGGPASTAVVALLAAIAAFAFGAAARSPWRMTLGGGLTLAAGALIATHTVTDWFQLRYYRGREEDDVVFERWNSFSRVAVRTTGSTDSLLIEIDAASNTMISRWDGDPQRLAHLRDGLIALQYALIERPSVFVIGSGGGVDLLTAVAAGARSITAVEVNPIIVDLMRNRYASFSGGVYLRPEVEVVTDEARSFIRRSRREWDVIQAGYVDTYAATAAGAFALTENTLYTREAYEDYLAHLTPGGIVAIQRYYEEPPQQSIRLVSLALAALARRGDPHPARHVVVVREGERASVLVKNSEFTPIDVARLEAHCMRSGLELVAAPDRPGVGLYGELLAASDPRSVLAGYPLDISAVTDDRPFFFYVVKPTRFWRGLLLHTGEFVNSRAVFLLTALLLVAGVLCLVMVLAPALLARRRLPGAALPAMLYFGALGLGFMLVEIGLLQRLMLFLGHPTLALSVVLTTLLVSAGLGSAWTRRVPLAHAETVLRRLLIAVLAMVVVVALVYPLLFRELVGAERWARIVVSVLALVPPGTLLGTAFPLGVRRLAATRADLIPWAWSVNGATSVLGSILAMVVAINNGFTATLLLGAAIYAVALALAPATAVSGAAAQESVSEDLAAPEAAG